MLGQAKINENLTKKLAYHDKNIESINSKLENLTSSVQNQLSFIKMIETQLAQIAAAIPTNIPPKTSEQPAVPLESANLVTIRVEQLLCHENFSDIIQSLFIPKKEDPGRPTIECSIGPHNFDNALCDLGSSINIMPRVIYDALYGGPLVP